MIPRIRIQIRGSGVSLLRMRTNTSTWSHGAIEMAGILNRLAAIGFGLAASGAVISNTLYNGTKTSLLFVRLFLLIAVDGGERVVIFDRFRGVLDSVSGEGTHFLIPWVQKPVFFSIRSKPRNVPVVTGSKGTLAQPT